MKRFGVYRQGALDEDSVAVLDFMTVPEADTDAAVQEAYDMACSDAVYGSDSLEEVYDEFPHLCGFEAWIWKTGRGWQPQGLNRELLIGCQKKVAKNELATFLRGFLFMYSGYMNHEELHQVMDEVFSEKEERETERKGL